MPGPFSPQNRPTGSHGAVFINSDIHRTFYDMLFFSLSHRIERGAGKRAKMCLPDFSFPSTRSPVYKPALWILTQITLPTPTGMKTKPGEGASARFLAAIEPSSPFRKQLPLLLPHTFAVHSGHCGGIAALTDGMCRPASAHPCQGCLATSSHRTCHWPEVTWSCPSSP